MGEVRRMRRHHEGEPKKALRAKGKGNGDATRGNKRLEIFGKRVPDN